MTEKASNNESHKSGAGKFFLGAALGAIAGAIAGKMISGKISKSEEECDDEAEIGEGCADCPGCNPSKKKSDDDSVIEAEIEIGLSKKKDSEKKDSEKKSEAKKSDGEVKEKSETKGEARKDDKAEEE